MPPIHRRTFLKHSKNTGLGLAAGITILSDSRSVRGTPANEKIVLAAVGCGGRSAGLTKGFLERGDCEFAYACDPNRPRAEARAKTIGEGQDKAPQIVADFREVLEDKSVDAIVSATPDHCMPSPPSGPAKRGRMCTSRSRQRTTAGKGSRCSRRLESTSGSFSVGIRTAARLT